MEDNVRQRVQRIFKIWEEREVYPSAFIAKLNKQLDPANQVKEAPPPPPPVKVAADFEVNYFQLKYIFKHYYKNSFILRLLS